jgi:Response receiver domain
MTRPAPEFGTLCKEITQRFLRTAILIDDEIVTPPPDTGHEAVEALVEPPFLAEGESQSVAGADLAARAAEISAPEPVLVSARSDVALKPLADAFLDQKIICAVLNPATEDEADRIVERAVNASSSADIVIIDWYLRKGDAELTIRSLIGLLSADAASSGRKRMVIVYTSATPLEQRCEELRQRLEHNRLPASRLEGPFPTLRSGFSRIVFVEKASGERGTTVEQLPDLALAEFVKEADGLMPIFALGAIAQIRDATHHLLSIFRPELDSALVGHRMVLQEPTDARDFALELFLLQLKGVLSSGTALDSVLDKNTIGAWFKQQFPTSMDQKLSAAGITRAQFQLAVEDADPKERFGSERVKGFHSALFLTQGDFDAAAERERSCELARLSSHLREAEGVTPLPHGWRPHLTLGTILRFDAPGGAAEFFLCTQPLCDTLRLNERTFFSFVKLEAGTSGNSNDYWIIVRSDGVHVQLKAKRNAPGRHFAKFAPDVERKKIMAAADGENPRKFTFTDEGGKIYRWVADIDRMKAQRAAEEMASSLGRVGVDEYEWLRMGGKIKF